eukprot:TRINITY_DN12307_c0_g1_i1.p1 TRINITY_DN12307_c0_g1~~TRINITY_DN12307_c0_g1_i1.p1  ORF type:complete len:232 (+),score=46.99 TRINITY_DN12307_c0_g1_i1:53-697(+)
MTLRASAMLLFFAAIALCVEAAPRKPKSPIDYSVIVSFSIEGATPNTYVQMQSTKANANLQNWTTMLELTKCPEAVEYKYYPQPDETCSNSSTICPLWRLMVGLADAHFNSTEVIDGVEAHHWTWLPRGSDRFDYWTAVADGSPVRQVDFIQNQTYTYDYTAFSEVAPPPDVFDVPSYCQSSAAPLKLDDAEKAVRLAHAAALASERRYAQGSV